MSSIPTLVQVPARPTPLSLDLSKTAVLVVDMQNDFGARGGMFDRAGIDIEILRAVVAPIGKVLDAARAARIPVIYLKMEYAPDLSDLGPPDSVNAMRHLQFRVGKKVKAPDGSERRFLIRGTWNTEIINELRPHAGDTVVSKHRFSGFFETKLDETLKARGTKSLIVTGCTTSVCVESTIRDAMFRDYSCLLLSDCTAEPVGYDLPRSNHEASLTVIETLLGWVSTSREFLTALKAI